MPMQDLLHAALAGVNLPYTIGLALVLLYWLSVILGALDFSAFDLDLDADAAADLDADASADGMSGWFAGALHFFNFGKAPFMLIMSIALATAWALAVLGNHYVGGYQAGFALATALPILFIGLLAAKVLTAPFLPFFEQLMKEAQPVDYAGMECQLLLPASPAQMGQAKVIVEEDELLIYVKPVEGSPLLPAGSKGIVSRAAADGSHYLIRPLN